MRQNPSYFRWLVNVPSAEDADRLQKELVPLIAQDALFVNEVRTGPGDKPTVWQEPHRLGDYFVNIRVLSPAAPGPNFQVVFHRRPGAGRFWKDLMVRILQQLRQQVPGTTTTLAYQGDEEPQVASSEH